MTAAAQLDVYSRHTRQKHPIQRYLAWKFSFYIKKSTSLSGETAIAPLAEKDVFLFYEDENSFAKWNAIIECDNYGRWFIRVWLGLL
jgi:hypothetical protein